MEPSVQGRIFHRHFANDWKKANKDIAMKPKTTRTLNPLPFQDLEPHRFEDLVRQLAYDLRRWKALEATGRSGSDEGVDIRATELVRVGDELEDFDEGEPSFEERLWIFQCKREKTFGPQKLRKAVIESLASLKKPPHGFILAISTDVSKKARDAFREEMVTRDIEEFAIWAKGELEDMLFQPKNDRLLFAYFGLSLQPKRRSLVTTLRSQIARKKELTKLIEEDEYRDRLILLRDPTDERYPKKPETGEPPARWLACHAVTMRKPGHLVVLRHEYLACTTPDCTGWDMILDHDQAQTMVENDLRSDRAWGFEDHGVRFDGGPDDFWREHIHEQDQAYLKVYRSVPIDRILAIDPIGDGFYPVPHVLIQFDDNEGPFSPGESAFLERLGTQGGRIELQATKENRVVVFPTPLPSKQDPTPAQFDDTGDTMEPLSDETNNKVSKLLVSLSEQPEKPLSDVEDGQDSTKRWKKQRRPFLKWRDKVAMPLFSAFVKTMRDSGHDARVVLRSVDHVPQKNDGVESIMIRVQLHTGTSFNPSQRARGHFGISLSEYTGWRMDISPTPDRSDSQSGLLAATGPDEMPKDQLEAQILALLDRLKSRGY